MKCKVDTNNIYIIADVIAIYSSVDISIDFVTTLLNKTL